MKVKDIVPILSGKFIVVADEDRACTGGYAGDLLSHCMGKAKTNGAWFTIMNNVNVAAVASLCDVACIVLCEETCADDVLIAKCEQQGINLVSTPFPIYEACVKFGKYESLL